MTQLPVEQAVVEVKRTMLYSLGTRLWYVILGEDDIFYQRWSSLMDDTDEVLFVTQVGDTLNIDYVSEFHNTDIALAPSKVVKHRIVSAKML